MLLRIVLPCFSAIIPLVMIFAGRHMRKNPPDKIDSDSGYFTQSAAKTLETWRFAHMYCGKLWWKTGLILLPLAIAAQLLCICAADGVFGLVGVAAIAAGVLLMIFSAFLTERALKRNFYPDGSPRNTISDDTTRKG